MYRWAIIIAAITLAGCQNGHPYLGGQQLGNNPAPGAAPSSNGTLAFNGNRFDPTALLNQANTEAQALNVQMQDAQRKLAQFDNINRELTARVAQAEQMLQSEREQKRLMQQQLADAGSRLKEALASKDELTRQSSAMFASAQAAKPVGGATITANNSIRTSLRVADVAGLDVRQEGTTIRVEIPADKLFTPGAMQLSPPAGPLLESIAAAVTRNYPKQLIVIEGHTDSTSNNPQAPSTSHQIAAAQSHAVVDYFLSRNLLPASQVSSMSFGSHRPRVSNATPQGQAKNRRLEMVIYPDTIDGKP